MNDAITEVGAFGHRLGAAYYLADAPSKVSQTASEACLALTELCGAVNEQVITRELPQEDAFLISLQLREVPRHQVWEDDKPAPAGHVGAWQTVIYDLKRRPTLLLEDPFHSMNFYIPRQAFVEVADACESKAIRDLSYRPGIGITDVTIANLIRILMSTFRQPAANQLHLFDHVCVALVTHVAQTYGGMAPQSRAKRGGLAPWQQRRVMEVIASRTDGLLTVGHLANECRLSHRHFCRAFRHSIGMAPHMFMQNARIDQAKTMLADTELRLGEVGLACGFADQSHFTRVFTQFTAMTPGAWRKNACPVDLR